MKCVTIPDVPLNNVELIVDTQEDTIHAVHSDNVSFIVGTQGDRTHEIDEVEKQYSAKENGHPEVNTIGDSRVCGKNNCSLYLVNRNIYQE